ncbi:MAG: hypothetical protein KF732_11370 [Flavobacteriales bacterium]|nr:MAG: hypothetical protein F9K09_03720 [Flavobacteriales bacterium]MBX2960542.1 hypothetical protein [Flavobacteriales bacterium]
MNIQADISWIRSELTKVQDPELIAAFKNLLKYRNKRIELSFGKVLTKTQFVNDIKEASSQIEKGDCLSIDDFEKESNKWK